MTSPDHPVLDHTTACACGKVELAVTGAVRAMLLCSCLDCQKMTGAGHSAVVIVDAGDAAVHGTTTSFRRPADSGAVVTQHFCPVCGTKIWAESTRVPNRMMIPTGLFASSGDWFRPNQLIFARSHQAWDVVAGDLPQHQRYRETSPDGGHHER